MRDTVRKYIPYYPFEFDAIEAWLEKQSQKGLELVDISIRFAKFERRTPKKVRWRIDNASCSTPVERADYLEGCKALGWDYVTLFPEGYMVFRTEDENAIEFHTDPAVFARSMKPPIRLWTFNTLFLIAVIALNSSFFFSYFRIDGVLEKMVEEGFGIFPYGAVVLFLCVAAAAGRLVSLLMLRRRLRAGEALAHRGRAYRSGPVRTTVFAALIVLVIVWVGWLEFVYSTAGNPDRYLIDTYDYSYRFPLLEEINPAEGEALPAGYGHDYVMFGHTELAPAIVMTRQIGDETETGGEDDSSYRRYYTVNSYELRSERLAEKYFEKKAAVFGDGGAEEIAYSGLDAVLYDVGNTSNGQYLLIRKGNIVVIVRYVGDSSLPDYLDLFAADLA